MNLGSAELAELVELAGGCHEDGISHRDRARPAHAASLESGALTMAVVGRGNPSSVYLTLAAARLGEVAADSSIELLMVDAGAAECTNASLADLEWDVPGLRYVPAQDPAGIAAARDRAFREAASAWVLCLEPGVLLVPGALSELLAFIDEHPHSNDLIQGPRLYDDGKTVSTHWEPGWRGGQYGVPHFSRCDRLGIASTEIPMQSLAVFACRREAWPGCNSRLRGDATDEGYVHEKYRNAGSRTLCLPGMRWMKRPTTPVAEAVTTNWEDRIRNYLIAWDELDLPTKPLATHFRKYLGTGAFSVIESQWRSEMANPFNAFDGIFCINLDSRPDRWQRVRKRFEELGIADRVRRISGVSTPQSSHIGCALAHRRALEVARSEAMTSVLVFEDDVVFLNGARWVLRRALEELARQEWDLLYLGTYPKPALPRVADCHHLDVVDRKILSAHAVVYRQHLFDPLLDELPDDIEGMTEWARRHPIDIYLSEHLGARALRVAPMIATQESVLPIMPKDLRDEYSMGPGTEWMVTSQNGEPFRAAAAPSTSAPAGISVRSATRTKDGNSPSVTAVMVTGHDEGRRSLARCTAEAFPQQTYDKAELLIINQGHEPLLCQPVERVREVMDGAGLVVGALRNLAWRYMDSDLMACWDDDDVHHPERLTTEVSAYLGQPVALRQELVLHLQTGESCIDHRRGGFENSLLWPSGCESRYSAESSGSDTYFFRCLRQEFDGVTTLSNPPSLYVRLFHGRNIWDEDHIIYRPIKRGYATEPSAVELQLLDDVLSTRRPLVS